MERTFCKKWPLVGSLEVVVICLVLGGHARGDVAITVESTLPPDIPPGGAVGATLQQSAAFAWQEFIAANWPALAGQRDVPDTHQKFGASSSDPLVWQTYRSKVEIFDLAAGTNAPPGYSATPPDYGYNAPPAHYYANNLGVAVSRAARTGLTRVDQSRRNDADRVDVMFAGWSSYQEYREQLAAAHSLCR